MGRAYTRRTTISTITAFKKKLENKRVKLQDNNKEVDGHDYVFFYYAIGDAITAKTPEALRANRMIWQEAMIEYMEHDGSISCFLDKIVYYVQKLSLHSSFKLNDKHRENSFDKHRKKYFLAINNSQKIKPEHAIEYHLLHKAHPELGKFIAYEFPLDSNNFFGGIDLIAYNQGKKELSLIELKKVAFGESKDSREMFLRAYTEIITYRACFDMLMKERRAELQNEFNELGERLGFKINLDDLTIRNCIIGPKSLYEDVDKKLREFVKTTDNPVYQVKLYSLAVHKDDILKYPIDHPEMMVDIAEEDFK